MKLIQIAVVCISIWLGGCAVSGSVQSVNTGASGFNSATYRGEVRQIADSAEIAKYPASDQHRVFEQSATGYGSIPEARDQAMPRVIAFCRSKNKEPKVLQEQTSIPPHILGNFPRIEITFACVDKSSVATISGGSDDRFSKLKELKTLLDSGTITQEEFENEKRKILR